jgi:hypothetical protein
MFMVAGTVGPFAAVVMASLMGIAMMADRYVLIAIIAFLGLAAIGAASFESKLGQMIVFVLIVGSAQRIKPSSVDWRAAVAIASAKSSGNSGIGIVPGYALIAVRYHLPPERRPLAVGLKSQCGDPQILIVSTGWFIPAAWRGEHEPSAYLSRLKACYPRLLGRASGVEVRSR